MPRMMDPTMETAGIARMQGFQFSATRLDRLGATEYTLVTIAVDVTGSVFGFEADLRNCLVVAVASCKKSPRSDNLLLRVIFFSSALQGGISEIHGFKPLAEINPNDDYPKLVPGGATPLYDAAFSAIGATNAYAKKLIDQDFTVNGIVFVITDGDDNTSSVSIGMIKQEMDRGTKGEEIESLVSILIGVNAAQYKHRLEAFAQGAGLQYVDAGDATKGRLAKLAQFVSQSTSSQSQALGTGGPSQAIVATI